MILAEPIFCVGQKIKTILAEPIICVGQKINTIWAEPIYLCCLENLYDLDKACLLCW